jgi:hypothetical protein
MIEFLRKLLTEDANEAIDLGEGEEILHVTGRHWILLLRRLILPLLGIAFFGGMALYRAAGGGFLVRSSLDRPGFDLLNLVLAGIVLTLMALWLILWVRQSKDRRPQFALLLVGAVLVGLIYYRYNGGRLFYIDPGLFADQTFDLLNIALITMAVVALFFVFFNFYDWLNDELILTNKRVVYDNDQVFIPRLIERRVQEQIFIEDVQNVVANTKTYPQHWLNYGTVIVKSARFGGELQFDGCNRPKDMQNKIMEQVRAYRKQYSERDFERMIETRIYSTSKPKAGKQQTELNRSRAFALVSWLVPDNPEYNEDRKEYIWRAHWLFLVRALIGPCIFGVVGLIVVASMVGRADPLLTFSTACFFLLAFSAYFLWEAEDYRNDLYILTPSNVIDIDKKPFGPEDRREASLGAINNVSFETTFISNLLGYGNVVLETAGGGGKFTFDHVPKPRDVVAQINTYYVEFKRQEKEKSLNDTLDLLRHYHNAQQRHNEINTPPA